MQTKILEIRDRGTRIDVIAIKLEGDNDIEKHYIKRAGYGEGAVIMMILEDCEANNDPYKWRYMFLTKEHIYIRDHFDELNTGDVVDAEFLRGETKEPKKPGRLE